MGVGRSASGSPGGISRVKVGVKIRSPPAGSLPPSDRPPTGVSTLPFRWAMEGGLGVGVGVGNKKSQPVIQSVININKANIVFFIITFHNQIFLCVEYCKRQSQIWAIGCL